MGVPGFTADVTERSQQRYWMTSEYASAPREADVIVPQAWWECCSRPYASSMCQYWLSLCCLGYAPCDPAIDICGCYCCPYTW